MSRRTDETIDLVFFDGCPHVGEARASLAAALESAGRRRAWREFRTDDPELPSYAAGFGSPSIFVGGREITGAPAAGDARSCRLYARSDGMRGAPELHAIVAALKRSDA
jgi:hypothetical protein